ncbi:MAG: alpha/beta hydrolase [Anaerolineae bacterium]|jgi:pimeloyl-ACP methyl ester carboxylesterase
MPYFTYRQLRLFYREQGQGPLLLILPGSTASSAAHLGELAYFGERTHTVALDFPGTGQSERMDVWPDDWWLEGARAAVRLMDHLSAAQAVAIGTSGGGVAALLMAQLVPDRVRAVVADSCVMRQPPEVLRAEVANRRQRQPGAVEFWQAMHGEDWERVVEADSDLLLRLAQRDGRFFERSLSDIRCPVLLSGSLRDSMLFNGAAQMVEMASQIPEAQLYLVNGGDHPLMWTRPELFRRAVDVFLDPKLGE